MPVNLLQHIILRSANLFNIKTIAPSEDQKKYIDDFFIFPCNNMSESLAYNDGTPMLAFLSDLDSEVELIDDTMHPTFKSGWFSTRSFAKMSVRLPLQVTYLIIVRFNLTSFYSLFRLNAKELGNRPFWNLQAIFNDSTGLIKEMKKDADINERIRLIESYIRNMISTQERPNSLLNAAIRVIRQQRGVVSIEKLNRELGVNYKWLERNFSEKLGITPKTYISLQRFINAYVSLLAEREDLTSIAINNGYSDTNHFIKDFRKYTGQTPIQYLHIYKDV